MLILFDTIEFKKRFSADSDYFLSCKNSCSLIIPTIPLIRLRLDISNLLSTKKKPWCESTRALLFSDFQYDFFLRLLFYACVSDNRSLSLYFFCGPEPVHLFLCPDIFPNQDSKWDWIFQLYYLIQVSRNTLIIQKMILF